MAKHVKSPSNGRYTPPTRGIRVRNSALALGAAVISSGMAVGMEAGASVAPPPTYSYAPYWACINTVENEIIGVETPPFTPQFCSSASQPVVLVQIAGGAGTQGPQGAPGGPGPQGFQGAAGSGGSGSGSQGAQGAQGAAGAGTQGAQGNQGAAGGGSGTQGLQGAQGNNGSNGSQGLQGPHGVQGAQGTGAQGFQGAMGAQGAGPQGPQGVQGGTGPQGSAGSGLGTQGFQGFQGAAGVGSGSQGLQGAQGAVGAQGNNGSNGSQGLQGLSGPTTIFGNTGGAIALGAEGSQGVVGAQGFQAYFENGEGKESVVGQVIDSSGYTFTNFRIYMSGNGPQGAQGSYVFALRDNGATVGTITIAAGGGITTGSIPISWTPSPGDVIALQVTMSPGLDTEAVSWAAG